MNISYYRLPREPNAGASSPTHSPEKPTSVPKASNASRNRACRGFGTVTSLLPKYLPGSRSRYISEALCCGSQRTRGPIEGDFQKPRRVSLRLWRRGLLRRLLRRPSASAAQGSGGGTLPNYSGREASLFGGEDESSRTKVFSKKDPVSTLLITTLNRGQAAHATPSATSVASRATWVSRRAARESPTALQPTSAVIAEARRLGRRGALHPSRIHSGFIRNSSLSGTVKLLE